MRARKLLPLVVWGVLGLILFGLVGQTRAGLINAVVVEDKGTVTIIEGHVVFDSHMKITLHAPDWGDRAGTYERWNRERFVIDSIVTFHWWNIYPVTIHIPQPIILTQPVTIPFFMATGPTAWDLGPLPEPGYMDWTEMQDGYGAWHPAAITPISNVYTDLPSVGPHGEQYEWDLDNHINFIEPMGNFYLAQVTMTADELSIPEPTSLICLGLGGIGLLWKRRASR